MRRQVEFQIGITQLHFSCLIVSCQNSNLYMMPPYKNDNSLDKSEEYLSRQILVTYNVG